MASSHRPGAPPLYRPYRWLGADFQIGVRPFKPSQWILVSADHAGIMREKRERLAAFPGLYYRTLPGSLAAQHELRERVVSHLVNDHPGCFERTGSVVKSLGSAIQCDLDDPAIEPLAQLSQLVEEDFMLLEECDGSPRITAASNAYSSSGRLVAAVGRDLEWAHQPVPGLTRKLGPRIDRVVGTVHTTTPCERFNWQLTPLSTLFFPHDDPHAANAVGMHNIREALRQDPQRAGDLLWIRVERQTLSRLPDSQAVVFSLHTYSDPLSSIQSDVESARAMLALLRGYSEERWKYTEMDIVREPLFAWLESVTGGSG